MSAPRPHEQTPETRRREGSALTGLWAVAGKEMADHLSSTRMRILEVLILLTAAGTVYVALRNVETGGNQAFVYLQLFTTSQDPLPAFIGFMGFLIPLVAIALGFDSVNREFSERTLSRVLAQPIFRDALLFGKFLAGLLTIALVLTSIWLLIMGLGIFRLGVPPSGPEVTRSLGFLLAGIAYGGVWLALSMVFSIAFRQPATAALASIAVWLFFTVFWGMIAGLIAQAIQPVQLGFPQEVLSQARVELTLSRISPNTLYSEAAVALLHPQVRALGPVLPMHLQGAVLGTPLPVGQSFLLIWPHLTGLIAGTILLFALGYVLFQRQEIRA